MEFLKNIFPYLGILWGIYAEIKNWKLKNNEKIRNNKIEALTELNKNTRNDFFFFLVR